MENLNAEQVKKALECCNKGTTEDCAKCPRFDGDRTLSTEDCMEKLMRDALALINSQEQRIKELTEENEGLKSQKYMIYADGRVEALGHNDPNGEPGKCGLYEQCRANTVREMQAEIINRCIQGGIYPAFVATTIDKIAKEMIDNVGTRCNRSSL